MAETFNLLPIRLEERDMNGTKMTTVASPDAALAQAMQQINALTNGFKQSGFALEVPPPPPNAVNPNRSKQVDAAKKQGNEAFKAGRWGDALKLYSMALDMAASRPPWEPSAMAADELSVLLCNRSAAFLGAELYAEAYADAHACVACKPTWQKGYFRKARACLKLGRAREAKEVLQVGLTYDPTSEELRTVEREVDELLLDMA